MERWIIILFLSSIFFVSCEKPDNGGGTTPPPPADSSIVDWVWETEVPEWSYNLQIDPMLYKDRIFVPLHEAKSLPNIKVFDKFSGDLIEDIFLDGNVSDILIRARLFNNHFILNCEEGLKVMNLDDNSLVWEYQDLPFEFNGPHINTLGEFSYNSVNLEIDGTTHPFYAASSLNKYHFQTGKREQVYVERHIDFKHFPFIAQPLIETIGGDTIITAHVLYYTKDSTAQQNTKLFRYNQTKKEMIWTVENFLEGAAEYAPIAYNNDILLTMGHSFYSFDAATGSFNYKLDFPSSSYHDNVFLLTPPVLYKGFVYIITDSGILYKVDPSTGTMIYEVVDPSATGSIKWGYLPWAQQQLLIKDDILFVNAKGRARFAMIDIHTGKFIEDFTDEKYSGTNILYDEEADLYYITTYGKIKAFRLKK